MNSIRELLIMSWTKRTTHPDNGSVHFISKIQAKHTQSRPKNSIFETDPLIGFYCIWEKHSRQEPGVLGSFMIKVILQLGGF